MLFFIVAWQLPSILLDSSRSASSLRTLTNASSLERNLSKAFVLKVFCSLSPIHTVDNECTAAGKDFLSEREIQRKSRWRGCLCRGLRRSERKCSVDGIGQDSTAMHDYFLKAASPFFRDMFEAGTKGGPVPLEASSGQLKFMMGKLTTGKFERSSLAQLAKSAPTSAYDNDYKNPWNLIAMHHIAEKYLLEDIGFGIRGLIAIFAFEHPPMALGFACQCSPANESIIRAAFEGFDKRLSRYMVDHYFESSCVNSAVGEYVSPLFDNISQAFARELGVDGLLAYAKALQVVFGPMTTSSWHGASKGASMWEKVADSFVMDMGTHLQNVHKGFMA